MVGHLSTAEIVGIVVGCVSVVGVIGTFIFGVNQWRYKSQKKSFVDLESLNEDADIPRE